MLKNNFLEKAIILREEGRFDQAIKFLNDGLAKFDNNSDVFALLSHVCILNDDLKNANLYLEKAKNIDPYSALVGWNEVRLLLKNMKVSEATIVARRTYLRFPDDIEGLGVLGSCLRASNHIEESLFYLDKAISLNPSYAEAFINRGLIKLSQKDKLSALSDFEIAYRLKPFVKPIWKLIIGLKLEFEQFSEMIPILTGMIKIDPNNETNFMVFGVCNDKSGKPSEAIEAYSKAIAINPDNAHAHYNLGVIMLELGNQEEAVDFYTKAILLKPDYFDSYYSLGNALKNLGRLNEALEAYQKALIIRPNHAEVFINVGNTLQKLGQPEHAIKAYNKALSVKPDYAEAYNNVANVLHSKGDHEAAVVAFSKAIAIKPDYNNAYYNLGIALKSLVFNEQQPGLTAIIIKILEYKTYVRPFDISPAVISLLKFEPAIQNLLKKHAAGKIRESLKSIISDLSATSLFVNWISVCPLTDLEIELALKEIRSALLVLTLETKISSEFLVFQSALALQCFTNEYVYDQADHETKRLKKLETIVKESLFEGVPPMPQFVLCLASYKALNEYEWCGLLNVNTDIEEVFQKQIIEPQQETFLKADIPVFQEITDNTSSKVRGQYEENPYPRWVNLHLCLNPTPISKIVEELKLRLSNRRINQVSSPDILVAGCGTGQQSLGSAATFKDAKVLAIDISLSSLAYAKRKTMELDVKNIEYMQADILDLSTLERQFDLVESSGVLHHMENPIAGWTVLRDCLKPGGLMRIGLYSELARSHIVTMRKRVKNLGIASSYDAMRSFRTNLIGSSGELRNGIVRTADFYSLSELRDLIFHVQEHRFTIPQIKDCLYQLGLEFCGFENVEVTRNFKLTNFGEDDLYDLDKWHLYEKENPSAFLQMYQFWCQKAL